MFVVTVIPFPKFCPSNLYLTPCITSFVSFAFLVISNLYFGVFSIFKLAIPLDSLVACVMLYSFNISSPESIFNTKLSPSTVTLNLTSEEIFS